MQIHKWTCLKLFSAVALNVPKSVNVSPVGFVPIIML